MRERTGFRSRSRRVLNFNYKTDWYFGYKTDDDTVCLRLLIDDFMYDEVVSSIFSDGVLLNTEKAIELASHLFYWHYFLLYCTTKVSRVSDRDSLHQHKKGK